MGVYYYGGDRSRNKTNEINTELITADRCASKEGIQTGIVRSAI